jgi:hypothetical protein
MCSRRDNASFHDCIAVVLDIARQPDHRFTRKEATAALIWSYKTRVRGVMSSARRWSAMCKSSESGQKVHPYAELREALQCAIIQRTTRPRFQAISVHVCDVQNPLECSRDELRLPHAYHQVLPRWVHQPLGQARPSQGA